MASPASGPLRRPATGGRGPAAPLAARLAVLAAAAAASAVGAWLGAWWVPFAAGLAAGVAGRLGVPGRAGASGKARPAGRGAVLAAAGGAVLGWALPLWVLALDGQPVGATARVIAGLSGLPPYAGVTVVVVLLLAALQVLAGAWLARAVMPAQRSARAAKAAKEEQ